VFCLFPPDVNPDPGAVVLRSDVLRKQLLHVNETDRLPESAYRTEITRQIYEPSDNTQFEFFRKVIL
jgi:predicted kinase